MVQHNNKIVKQLTNDIYQDGLHFIEENEHHYLQSWYKPISSLPYHEPWFYGTPHFTYYTEVDIPLYLLNCNFTTDSKCNLPNTIYIPPQGQSNSTIINKIIGQIIGKNGWWLKKLTSYTGLHYIWYNNKEYNTWGRFQLWGIPERLNCATYLLNQRISTIINKYNLE